MVAAKGARCSKGLVSVLIQHRGDNPRVTGWLRSGRYGMRQGRPLFPTQLRFRVVHVNRPRPLILELQKVPEPLQLQRLWLVRARLGGFATYPTEAESVGSASA